MDNKLAPTVPFPPHWFTVYRSGTIIGATLQPANCLIQATSWRLYPDSLRTSDLIHVFESLAHESAHCSLLIAYVDSIDSAHYLMESARVALAAFDDKTRDRLFSPPPVPPTEAEKPREPLPPGHPDSFSMEELRKQLAGEVKAMEQTQQELEGKTLALCMRQISHDNFCSLPHDHTGACQS